MSRFHRKTAPGVRDGRTIRNNNWKRSPSCYSVPQLIPTIDRRRPGPGYRHVLRKQDIERFVKIIPHWDVLSVGLNVIVLGDGRCSCDGWYNYTGVIGLPAWSINLREEVNAEWFRSHRDFLRRIEAHIEIEENSPDDIVIHWSTWTVRAYQLCHVFLHELGHHHDRMTTRSQRECCHGEQFAEKYAWEYEALIWERYLEEFGLESVSASARSCWKERG